MIDQISWFQVLRTTKVTTTTSENVCKPAWFAGACFCPFCSPALPVALWQNFGTDSALFKGMAGKLKCLVLRGYFDRHSIHHLQSQQIERSPHHCLDQKGLSSTESDDDNFSSKQTAAKRLAESVFTRNIKHVWGQKLIKTTTLPPNCF